MTKLPHIQLYTGDWLKDPALSMCSVATRGFWIDLICRLHESDTGTLTGTAEQFAQLCRCLPSEAQAAIGELQATGAADVRDAGTNPEQKPSKSITCRRILKERKMRTLRRRAGVESGNKRGTEVKQNTDIDTDIDNDIRKVPKVKEAYDLWIQHRLELGKPLTRQAVKQQLAQLAEWGADRAESALKLSVARGWQGIYEGNQGTYGNHVNGKPIAKFVTRNSEANAAAAEEYRMQPVSG